MAIQLHIRVAAGVPINNLYRTAGESISEYVGER